MLWGGGLSQLCSQLPSAVLSWVIVYLFISNKNFHCNFLPEVEGAQIVFPYVVSDENAFLPLFLSLTGTSGKIFEYFQRPLFFFFLALLFTLD